MDDPDTPFISTMTAVNEGGKEDVHLLAGGADGQQLASAIESAFADVLKAQMQRAEFSGHFHLVIQPTLPPPERKHLLETIRQLKEICAELSTGAAPYRLTVLYQRDTLSAPADSTPAAAPIALGGVRASGGWQTRLWVTVGVGVVVAAVAVGRYLSSTAVTFPDTVAFGQQSLNKAANWNRDGISGAVYVAPGEKMPNAALQVGVMVSTDHQTASELDAWIRGQYNRSNTQRYYDSEPGDVSCKAGLASTRDDARPFMAVQVCKNGEGRAACAESDQIIEANVLTQCDNAGASCFVEACAMRERDDAGWLSMLVLDALGKK